MEQQGKADGWRLAQHQQQQIDLIHQAAEMQKRQLLGFVDDQARRQEARLRELFAVQAGGVAQQLLEATMDERFRAQVAEFEEHANHLWVYDPEIRAPLDIREQPDVDGPRTGLLMHPGETFGVSEVRVGELGVLFLGLLDGRGWVFDRKPGAGTMCRRTPAPAPGVVAGGRAAGRFNAGANIWIHRPSEAAPLTIRSQPDIGGQRTAEMLMPGDVFEVSREVEGRGPDGTSVIYLKLADGRGWVFDRKPGAGLLCQRHHARGAAAPPPPGVRAGAHTPSPAQAAPQLYSQVAPSAVGAVTTPLHGTRRRRHEAFC